MSQPDLHSPETSYGTPGHYDHGLDFREKLRRLWGYKWLIATVVALVVGTTWLVVQQMTPRYTATATLMVEPPKKNVIELGEVVEDLDMGHMTMAGEVEVLKSRELAAKAVARLGLSQAEQPDESRNTQSIVSHLNPFNYIPTAWKEGVGAFWQDAKASILGESEQNGVALNMAADEPLIDDLVEIERNRDINRFLSGLSVSTKQWSKVVRVSFTSEDPKFAANAANALAEAYVQDTVDIKYAGTREAAEWLDSQLQHLRQRVEESEAKLEYVRQGDALVQGRNSQVISQQISSINEQMLAAQAHTARLRARVQQIEKLQNTPDGSEESTSIIGSGLIQTLRLEQFRLEREEADLALELGDRHPRMINIRAEIIDIARKLRAEIKKYVEAARSELAVAQAQQSALKRNLTSMTNQVGDVSQAEIQLRTLEREAEANRKLFESFLNRSKETRVQQEIQQPDARILSYAQVPGGPSYPPKQKYINFSIVGSLGLALGLVALLEKLDKGFRTARQVEQQIGLPLYAMVPSVKLSQQNVKEPADLITRDGHSRFTESINILYSNLKWPRDGTVPKTILVSSPLPKEGKTSTAIALARRAAFLGDKVLLIDGDFRHPLATRKLKLKHHPGIGDVISGDVQLEEALQRDEASGVIFLSSGKTKDDPVALLGSERFRRFLDMLKETFDLIIFDSSPILAVTESQILARAVDQTIVLVRWGNTPRQAAIAAVKQLQDFGAQVSGLAMTRVDVTKQSYYGYGEYGYYTGKMKGYYSDASS
jgi:capsular exopolysaccharide synthesis family protein